MFSYPPGPTKGVPPLKNTSCNHSLTRERPAFRRYPNNRPGGPESLTATRITMGNGEVFRRLIEQQLVTNGPYCVVCMSLYNQGNTIVYFRIAVYRLAMGRKGARNLEA